MEPDWLMQFVTQIVMIFAAAKAAFEAV